MKELLQQLKWQFMILHKNNLINISVGVTIIYALIFYAIRHLGDLDRVLTLLVFNDPAVIGLLFIGLGFLIEKNQGVLAVYFVTPHNLHAYLLSRILSLSIVGMLCALGMAFFAKGLDYQVVLFAIGALSTCLIFSALGLIVVSYSSEFLIYLLKSIPILFLMALPLFNYFGLTTVWTFKLLPTQACVDLIDLSYQASISAVDLVWPFISLGVWLPLLYFISFRIFKNRLSHESII